jgi:hypothetical protein
MLVGGGAMWENDRGDGKSLVRETIKNLNLHIYILYIATQKYTQNSNTQNYEIVYYKTIRFWYTKIY